MFEYEECLVWRIVALLQIRLAGCYMQGLAGSNPALFQQANDANRTFTAVEQNASNFLRQNSESKATELKLHNS